MSRDRSTWWNELVRNSHSQPRFAEPRRHRRFRYAGDPAVGAGALRREPGNIQPVQPRRSAATRRRLPAALIPTDDALRLRLAEELDYARSMLDLLGDALTADPDILTRHTGPLQSIDIVGQILGHIATVVRSSDPGRRRRTYRHEPS